MKRSHTHRHERSRGADQAPASEGTDRHLPVARRELLLAGSTVATGFLAGCTGGESDEGPPPEPVSLAGNKECDVCGMVISEHPGPNGQIFYRDNSPEGHDNPARFDSPKACLFPYYFAHEQRDWSVDAVYVTDYSRVDYDITTVEGRTYIRTATAPETFSNAEEVVFVVESEVHGAMGPDFIPFSDEDEGAAFTDEYGGRTVVMEDITRETIGR